MTLAGAGALHRFPLGGAFVDNDEDLIHLTFSSIRTDTTFAAAGIPYLLERSIEVSGTGALTLSAGVELRFAADAVLDVGWNSLNPTLRIEGTESAPVVLRGADEAPAFWGGLWLEAGVTSSSRITYVTLAHAGSKTNTPLYLGASVLLDHVTLSESGNPARLEAPLAAGSTALQIHGGTRRPLRAQINAVTSLPADSTFSGNGEDYIGLYGTSYNAVGMLRRFDAPYLVEAHVATTNGSSLTIEAGTEIVFAADADLELGWNYGNAELIAVGTPEAPIVLRGLVESPGSWRGLLFNGTVRSTSRLDYVEVRHAGTATGAAVITGAAIPITHSRFSESAGYGILYQRNITLDYGVSNTFESVARGPLGTY